MLRFSLIKSLSFSAIAVTAFLSFVWSFAINQFFDEQMLYATGVSLIFIPAGVKLLFVLVGGLPAVLGLFAASIYLSGPFFVDLQPLSFVYFALVSVGTYALAVYLVKRKFKIQDNLSNLAYWQVILLALTASVLNGFGHNIVFVTQGVTAPADFFDKSTAMAFGDFLGCFVVVMLFNAAIRLARRLTGPSLQPRGRVD